MAFNFVYSSLFFWEWDRGVFLFGMKKQETRTAPRQLAIRSAQSPLRLLVAYSCSSSIVPLISMGRNSAPHKALGRLTTGWLRRCSSQMMLLKPPYMQMWTSLSMWMICSSKSVCGMVKKERKRITAVTIQENLYRNRYLFIVLFVVADVSYGYLSHVQ